MRTASPPPPNVTLVVPNYNHAHYLLESLGSIAAQTRAPDRVLIIDDGSTDDSIAVISRFLPDHPNWQLIRHENNQGVVRGQNEALALAETDWIGFLGADDALHPSYLEKALAAAERHPESGLICACCEIIGPSQGRMLRPMMLPARASMMMTRADVRRILLTGDNYFSGTVSLYRRSALQAMGGFDVKLGSFSDAFLARRLALTYGFYFLADILGYWRIHGQNYSTVTATDPVKLADRLADIRTEIADSDLFPPDYAALFERRTRFGAARMVLDGKTPAAVRATHAASLLGAGRAETQLLRLLLSVGPIGPAAALAWVTLRTRPMSLARLLGQLGTRRAIVGATPTYRAR